MRRRHHDLRGTNRRSDKISHGPNPDGTWLIFHCGILCGWIVNRHRLCPTVSEFVNILDNRKVCFIVNTHSHEDHIGANKAVQAKFGSQILAHSDALPVLLDPSTQKLRPYQIVMWGYPQSSTGTAIGEELETEHHKFRVIHTPGHSPDHITLYEPDRGWIFSGDT